MANNYRKRCSSSLAIREMEIKTTIRYLLTPVRMAIVNKTIRIIVGEVVEKKEPSFTAGGNVNCIATMEKHYEHSS